MILEELREDCAIKQKKGIHFIIASILVWTAVIFVQQTDLPILTKNLFTFCCTVPLLPVAYIISKILKIEFSDKNNKLNELGFLFSLNQMLYLIIAMWVYSAVPDKLVMVIAIIFGAHLLPYSWLYKSKSYFVAACLIPILSLIIGCIFNGFVLSIVMVIIEVVFTISLTFEIRGLNLQKTNIR